MRTVKTLFFLERSQHLKRLQTTRLNPSERDGEMPTFTFDKTACMAYLRDAFVKATRGKKQARDNNECACETATVNKLYPVKEIAITVSERMTDTN